MWVGMMSSIDRPCIEHLSSTYCPYIDHTSSIHRPHVVHFVFTSSLDRMSPRYRPRFVDEVSTYRMYRPYRPQDRHIVHIAHVSILCRPHTSSTHLVVHISSIHRPDIAHIVKVCLYQPWIVPGNDTTSIDRPHVAPISSISRQRIVHISYRP